MLVISRLRLKKEKSYRQYLINKFNKDLEQPTKREIQFELKKLLKEIKETADDDLQEKKRYEV